MLIENLAFCEDAFWYRFSCDFRPYHCKMTMADNRRLRNSPHATFFVGLEVIDILSNTHFLKLVYGWLRNFLKLVYGSPQKDAKGPLLVGITSNVAQIPSTSSFFESCHEKPVICILFRTEHVPFKFVSA